MGAADSAGIAPSIRVSGISPEPDPDVVAAVTIALLEAWPKPSMSAPTEAPNTVWRFGQRRWHDRAVPRRTWGASR